VARVPRARLFVAGEGRLESALRARHARLGLGDRAVFLGARLDVADLVAACDVFVLSSSREGLSVTLLEAMRAGRACVATDVGGNAEAVEQGVTGRVVPPGDATALGDALAEALAEPAALVAWGRAGRERWERLFTAERMVRETERLYADVLAARGGAVEAAHAAG
jgi:glycosyltransferase involved in cell wall biosynthesis